MGERMIPGDYEKFSSNTGWLIGGHPALEAFSHFTYADVSNHDGSPFQGKSRSAGKLHGGKGKKGGMDNVGVEDPSSDSIEDDTDHRRILVCDLQGLDGANSRFRLGRKSKVVNFYMLTDPAICSAVQGGEGTYGHTDLGPRGLLSFFVNHTCNVYCHKLGIAECRPKIPDSFEPCAASRSTGYFSKSGASSKSSSQVPTQSVFARSPSPYSYASLPANVGITRLRLEASSVKPTGPPRVLALLAPVSENDNDEEEGELCPIGTMLEAETADAQQNRKDIQVCDAALNDPWNPLLKTFSPRLGMPEACRAIDNFDSGEFGPGYLSITKGELLMVQPKEEGGWRLGQSVQSGLSGWLPATYVRTEG